MKTLLLLLCCLSYCACFQKTQTKKTAQPITETKKTTVIPKAPNQEMRQTNILDLTTLKTTLESELKTSCSWEEHTSGKHHEWLIATCNQTQLALFRQHKTPWNILQVPTNLSKPENDKTTSSCSFSFREAREESVAKGTPWLVWTLDRSSSFSSETPIFDQDECSSTKPDSTWYIVDRRDDTEDAFDILFDPEKHLTYLQLRNTNKRVHIHESCRHKTKKEGNYTISERLEKQDVSTEISYTTTLANITTSTYKNTVHFDPDGVLGNQGKKRRHRRKKPYVEKHKKPLTPLRWQNLSCPIPQKQKP